MEEMSKQEFIAKMVTLGVRHKDGYFPRGSWRQNGSILSAYIGNVLAGQYDEATGKVRTEKSHQKEFS